MTINGNSGQTSDLIQFYRGTNYSGAIERGGAFNIQPSIANNGYGVFVRAGAATGMIIRSGGGNLQQWQNSSNQEIGSYAANGAVSFYSNAATAVPLTLRGAAGQSVSLQEWQNSGPTVVARISSVGLLRTGDSVLANQYVGVVGTSTVTDTTALAGLQANTSLGGGWVQFKKLTSAVSNPGANFGNIYFRDGTTAGTLKLVVRAGAAGAETTILDNIPQ